jgi:hypothetical protein
MTQPAAAIAHQRPMDLSTDEQPTNRRPTAQGYNATVLAYGQTGSGKTHTMTGGVGIHGVQEQGEYGGEASHMEQQQRRHSEAGTSKPPVTNPPVFRSSIPIQTHAGITRRAARHIFAVVDALTQRLKPGESIRVGAYALELYNEDLRDLSIKVGGGTYLAVQLWFGWCLLLRLMHLVWVG